MINYRAVAVGLLRDGHPVQYFGQHLTKVALWAEAITKQDRVPVDIYEYKEVLLRTEMPPDNQPDKV